MHLLNDCVITAIASTGSQTYFLKCKQLKWSTRISFDLQLNSLKIENNNLADTKGMNTNNIKSVN